jgi:hypothetical protein
MEVMLVIADHYNIVQLLSIEKRMSQFLLKIAVKTAQF